MRTLQPRMWLLLLLIAAFVAAPATAEEMPLNTIWFSPNLGLEFGSGWTGASVGGTLSYDRALGPRLAATVTAGGTFSQRTDADATSRSGIVEFGAGVTVKPFASIKSLAIRSLLSAHLLLAGPNPSLVPAAAIDLAWSPFATGRLMLSGGLGASYNDGVQLNARAGVSFGTHF